jgi:hypothetical protein
MGHWLWCAVLLIEAFGLFWWLMDVNVMDIQKHTVQNHTRALSAELVTGESLQCF